MTNDNDIMKIKGRSLTEDDFEFDRAVDSSDHLYSQEFHDWLQRLVKRIKASNGERQ
jgi:hypothetical protein